MNDRHYELRGDLSAVGAMLLWSLCPIFIAASAGKIRPLLFVGSSILVAGFTILGAGLIFSRQSFRFPRSAILPAIAATILIVVINFSLIFIAGQNTAPGNLAIISQSEVFFSFLFFGLLGYERVSKKRVFGSILVFLSIVVLFSGQFESGELLWSGLIVLAAMIAPIGNFYQKKALQMISPIALLAFRNILGGLILFSMALVIEKPHLASAFSAEIIMLIALTGVISFGISKWMVLYSLRSIGVAKAIAINSLMPAFTILFSLLLLQEMPSWAQLIGLLLVIAGIPLISSRNPMSFHGTIVTGDQIGREIGFPTINIDTAAKLNPGVYAINLTIYDKSYQGVMHAGPRPTLGKTEFRIEAFLFDFAQNLKPKSAVSVHIVSRIRDVMKLKNREELTAQIQADVQVARKILNN